MLIDKIKKNTLYPMHMPGHKRNTMLLSNSFPYEIDITEIHGFDDLRYQQAELGKTADLAARLYESNKAFMLVNGSTVGILTAIGTLANRGDKILFAKSCHRSVHNAVELFGLKPIYIKTKTNEKSDIECSITPEMINEALEKESDIKLIVVTSPSYEGVISDVKTITDAAHKKNISVLVDSAHGAHLGFSDKLPENATKSGADVVVMSLHKTLPALTQCSLMHVCSNRVDIDKLHSMLFILQTSSPSYVLMASIDYCLRLLETSGSELFEKYMQLLTEFYKQTEDLKNLTVINPFDNDFHKSHPDFYDLDPGKIVVVTKNTSSGKYALADILRNEYEIELEASHQNHAIAMTSICDTPEGIARLATALRELDYRKK